MAERDESPSNRINSQEKPKQPAYQLVREERPRKKPKTKNQGAKRTNDILTKKTQIHLASPLRGSQKEPKGLEEKQSTQREKHKQMGKLNQ